MIEMRDAAVDDHGVRGAETHYGGRALVVVGGDDVYEDLFGASIELQDILTSEGFVARIGMGMGRFGSESQNNRVIEDDVIVLYTAMGEFTESQQRGLTDAVSSGVGLVAIHSSNVFAGTPDAIDEAYRSAFDLVGSRYASHGPMPHESRFRVNLTTDHEITTGLEGFPITHEHYRLELADNVRVLAWRDAIYGNEPILHVQEVGAGRVCYIQLGHDMRIWDEPIVRQLIGRAVRWARRTNDEKKVAVPMTENRQEGNADARRTS
jgi:uncharacterized protein